MTIRVGMIGFGMAGRVFHAPMIAATDGIDLVAVATSRGEEVAARLPGVAIYRTPEALIADGSLDLVVVATPNDRHAPLAGAALEAGRHVVVEKPMTVTLDDARNLAATAARENRLLATFHNRRWDSDFLTVAAAIADGAVGRVAHFESHFDRFRPEVADRWREVPAPGGGAWYDLGPHLIDQALQLFGLPDTVSLALANQRTGAQVDDWAHAVLAYPDLRVVLHASLLAAGGVARFTVHGDRGTLVKERPDQQEARLREGFSPWGDTQAVATGPLRIVAADGSERVVDERPGDHREFYRRVAAALRAERPNPVPPAQAIAVMATIVAGTRSAAEGRVVELDLTAEERAAFAASLA